MVEASQDQANTAAGLSVLALSSRFDGRKDSANEKKRKSAFSTRSVESF